MVSRIVGGATPPSVMALFESENAQSSKLRNPKSGAWKSENPKMPNHDCAIQVLRAPRQPATSSSSDAFPLFALPRQLRHSKLQVKSLF